MRRARPTLLATLVAAAKATALQVDDPTLRVAVEALVVTNWGAIIAGYVIACWA